MLINLWEYGSDKKVELELDTLSYYKKGTYQNGGYEGCDGICFEYYNFTLNKKLLVLYVESERIVLINSKGIRLYIDDSVKVKLRRLTCFRYCIDFINNDERLIDSLFFYEVTYNGFDDSFYRLVYDYLLTSESRKKFIEAHKYN